MSWDLVVVAGAALACGIVNAMAGGGSLLLFPALVASGMGTLAANVTNSVITLPGHVGASAGFHRELAEDRHRLPRLIGATVVGSTIGCVLLLATTEAAFDVVVPWLLIVASVLIAVQPAVVARLDEPSPGSARWWSPVGIAAATVYGGYFGAGLGVILLAVLGFTVPLPFKRLNALKAALSVVDATVSLVVFGVFGPVEWGAVAVGAPMTLLGGFLGAKLVRRVDQAVVRSVVVVLGLVAAAVLLVA